MPLRKKMPLSKSALAGPRGDDANIARRGVGLWPHAAAVLLVSSALRMVQAAAGGQWHGVGVTLSLGLFLVTYFLHLGHPSWS